MSDDLKLCPFCAEEIKAAAIVCKHCGRDLPIIEDEIIATEVSTTTDHKKQGRERRKGKDGKKKKRGCLWWTMMSILGLAGLFVCAVLITLAGNSSSNSGVSGPRTAQELKTVTVESAATTSSAVTTSAEAIPTMTPTTVEADETEVPTETATTFTENDSTVNQTPTVAATESTLPSKTPPAQRAAAVQTLTDTDTISLAATNTVESTFTPVPTSTTKNTPAPTSTNTPVPTSTSTPIPTSTSTSTTVPTNTSTSIPTSTSTSTPVPTNTSTPQPTATLSFQDRIDDLVSEEIRGLDNLQIEVVDMSSSGINGYDVYLTWKLSSGWSDQGFRDGARFDVKGILVAFNKSNIANYNELILFADADLVDKFGIESTDRVLKAVYHRDLVTRINPSYFVSDDVFAITDNYWLHPVLKDEVVEAQEPDLEWYQGGTLHSATTVEWINASPTNKLATAADWSTIGFDLQTIEEVAIWAPRLVACIDQAAPEYPSESSVAELAAACSILLKSDN